MLKKTTYFKALILSSLLILCQHQADAQDLSSVGAAKPIVFGGSFQARSMFYNASGIGNRQDPFRYIFDGNATATIYGWRIPFSFTYSQENKSFRQPFNKFGMSPKYKWITLHAGYRNLNFSPYTLAGHTMLGGGVELNPGKLRTAFMYGKLNRATVIDTTTRALVPFSFSRKGYAVKIGYGTDNNYFDLSFLKARDDSTSAPNELVHDSNNVLAAGNTVLGYQTHFTIKSKFFIEGDGAVSLYTRDINSPLVLDTADNAFLNKMKNFLDVNGTSQLLTAMSVGLGYKEQNYSLKLNYRRVDPGFQTMGAYYFSNDLESYTVNPTFNLLSGKLRGNVSIGIQRDDIRNQKQATNKRFIGTANIAAQFTERLGLDVNYSNFSNNQKPKTLSFADSLKIVQTTQVFSIMPRYLISTPNITHMFMLSANLSGMKDFNNYFGGQAEERNIYTNQYMCNYTVSFPAKRLSVFGNLSYIELDSGEEKDTYQGVSLGGNYSLANNKAQVGLNSNVMQGNSAPAGKSMIISVSMNSTYRLTNHHAVTFQLFVTNNNPGTAIIEENPQFTETRGELAYRFTF